MMADEGYVTIAFGSRHFLEMAVDLALSVREQDSRPIALITDAALERAAAPYREVFDAIVALPPEYARGRTCKFALGRHSPYARTMYIDADSLLLGSLEPAWRAASGHALMMVGERLTLHDDERHHHRSTRALMQKYATSSYLKSNSGLIYLERGAADGLLEECDTFYREALLHRGPRMLAPPDELAFGVVCGRRGVATFPQPGPMLWPSEIRALDLSAPRKPLLHVIGAPRRAVWRALQTSIRERRSCRALPARSRWVWELRRMKSFLNQ